MRIQSLHGLKAILVFLILACGGGDKPIDNGTGGEAKGDGQPKKPEVSYIVYLKPSKVMPMILDGEARQADEAKRDQVRKDREKLVYDYAASQQLVVLNKQVFVDVTAAFVTRLTQQQVQQMRDQSDTSYPDVGAVEINSVIELDDPIMMDEPIMQDEPIMMGDYELSPAGGAGSCFISCAVKEAGGSTTRPAAKPKVAVWVIDTGVGPHPDLVIDRSLGANTTLSGSSSTDDDNGHGTHVAGIIGANESSTLAAGKLCGGVSKGASLIPIKALNADGSGEWAFILGAVNWIAKYPLRRGDVVNLSLGAIQKNCREPERGLSKAILDLARITNHFIVMASGNARGDARHNYPGCITGPSNVITVGAIDCRKNCADYSNFGKRVDWLAVGSRIFSTWKPDPAFPDKAFYCVRSGTSMSTAVVSGIIHATGNLPVEGAGAAPVKCPSYPPPPVNSFKVARHTP